MVRSKRNKQRHYRRRLVWRVPWVTPSEPKPTRPASGALDVARRDARRRPTKGRGTVATCVETAATHAERTVGWGVVAAAEGRASRVLARSLASEWRCFWAGLNRCTELDRAKLGSAWSDFGPTFQTRLAKNTSRAVLIWVELKRASRRAEKLVRTSSPSHDR